MTRHWVSTKDESGKRRLVEKKPTAAHFLEAVAVTALLVPEIGRNRSFIDNEIPIFGIWTVEHGIWHNDPEGPTVNKLGQRGYYTYETLCFEKTNLLTFPGRDFIHNQAYTNTAAGTRGSGFIAVSADAGSPANADTTLTGEITTGGLSRADADTKQHVTNTNTTLIEHTFTASAIHTGVRRVMLFNAASGGTGTHSNTFTAANLEVGDTLKVSGTLTLG